MYEKFAEIFKADLSTEERRTAIKNWPLYWRQVFCGDLPLPRTDGVIEYMNGLDF